MIHDLVILVVAGVIVVVTGLAAHRIGWERSRDAHMQEVVQSCLKYGAHMQDGRAILCGIPKSLSGSEV